MENKALKKYFIGIDSDGTAFDSMTIKHSKAFIPVAIKVWNFEGIKDTVTEICERINLFSKTRGVNRFPGLLMMFEELEAKGEKVPDYTALKDYINSGFGFSNSGLESYMKENDDPFLESVMKWSKDSDVLFAKEVEGLMPFKYVKESLEKAQEYADIVVVSSASGKGLLKDWKTGKIDIYTSQILGQEAGTKKEQLKSAAEGKYDEDKIVMLGDALGDYEAAKSINALFFPIFPGKEEMAWENFLNEGLDRFLNGTFKGEYQNKILDDFNKMLK